MPVIPMQGPISLELPRTHRYKLEGAVGQKGVESNYAKGAVTFMKYANPQQAWPK